MAQWASQFEGEHGPTELVGLAVDSRGDVALAGHVFEDNGLMDGKKDAIVIKLASGDGQTLWRRSIGLHGTHDWSTAVAADANGDFFVAGQTDGYLFTPLVGQGHDLWVAKLRGNTGEMLWGYQDGSSGQDMASTLSVDASTGDVVVCGSTTGNLYDDPPYVFGNDGEQQKDFAASKAMEPFCAKLASEDGQVLWASRLHGGGNDGLLASAIDPRTKDVFAAGFTSHTSGVTGSDYVAMRLSGADGSQVWAVTGGGGWTGPAYVDGYVQDSACAIATDDSGDVILGGNTEGALFAATSGTRDTDAFVLKLNGTDGSELWGWQRGSSGNDYANGVAVDAAGDVYACGAASAGLFDNLNSARDAAPDSGDLTWRGGGEGSDKETPRPPDVADMFLAKLDGQSGSLLWGAQIGSGADDQAVGLVLGSNAPAAPAEGEDESGDTLYLAGWTRGALYSDVPARWQDGWAVKLSNPPPRTLGVSGASLSWGGDFLPTTPGSATQAASNAARGAVTFGLASTVVGMVILVAVALCIVLRRAAYAAGGSRYDQTKGLLRRRYAGGLTAGDGGGMKGSGNFAKDGVELTLLSENGEPDSTSPQGSGGIGDGGSARRDASPPRSQPQATFYI